MAARFWRSVFVGALAIAALLAGIAASAWSRPAGAEFSIALAGLLLPCAILVCSLICSRLWNGNAGSPDSQPLDALHAWLTEPVQFTRAVLAMMAASSRPAAQAETMVASRPVLLIHGVLCNHAIWRHWMKALRTAGFAPLRALDLEPILADIDIHAAGVAQELRALQYRHGGARVAIIAHSMGGLVARAALRIAGPGVISRIVTIATPHHGTRWARLLPFRVARQMRADSPWLLALNAGQEGHWEVPLTSIYSVNDALVVPPRSAAMAGATLHEMHGVGHLGVLGSPVCMKLAVAALEHP